MKDTQVAFGKQLLAQCNNQTPLAETIERDDLFIDFGSDSGLYFTEYNQRRHLPTRASALPAKQRLINLKNLIQM